MSFSCSRPFTLTINTPTPPVTGLMPLDQAIYSTNLSQIVGVRGQYLYTFNPTTGALITTKRVADDFLFGEASVVEVGSFLYVGLWRRMRDPNDYPAWHGDIYKVTPATLSVTALGIGGSIGTAGIGFSNLTTDGTFIYGTTGYSAAGTGSGVFQVNPLNPLATYLDSGLMSVRNITDMIWDSASNHTVWLVYPEGPEVRGIYAPLFPSVKRDVVDPTPATIMGGCLYPASDAIYCVGANRTIIKVPVSGSYGSLPIDYDLVASSSLTNILATATANPVKIKFNPNDNLIYVPTWAGDTVEVLNPATDTMVGTPKTGFSSPIDIVVVPGGKVWAVQNSAVGLVEIV